MQPCLGLRTGRRRSPARMQQLIWRSRCRRCRWRGRARRPPSAFGCRGGAVLVVGSAPLRARRAPPGFAASARRTRVLLYEALRNPTRGSSSLCSLGAPSRVVLTASDEVCRFRNPRVCGAELLPRRTETQLLPRSTEVLPRAWCSWCRSASAPPRVR